MLSSGSYPVWKFYYFAYNPAIKVDNPALFAISTECGI